LSSLLEITNLQAGYGDLQVLWDVSLTIGEGEFVVLLGPNGAGKTTTIRAVTGVIPILDGQIAFKGRQLNGLPGHEIQQLGISYVTEDLNLFPQMSVTDNLLVGAHNIRSREQIHKALLEVYELFPRLEERRKQLAGTLSGGERKMLGIGRGLMASPQLLLVDEPSLGLAPLVANLALEALQELNRRGITILLVEQRVQQSLAISQKAYVLEQGKIAIEGSSEELAKNPYIQQVYLGI
jgi:ABC-type branched-subunit amino acid transport system ATPase component